MFREVLQVFDAPQAAPGDEPDARVKLANLGAQSQRGDARGGSHRRDVEHNQLQ